MRSILQKRLLLFGSLFLLLSSFCFAIFSYQQLVTSAYNELELIAEIVPIENLEKKRYPSELRVTLISEEGDVLFDSKNGTSNMSNHLERPEIKEALEKGKGYSIRNSETMNTSICYYAIKLENGSILRVSKYVKSITVQFMNTLPIFLIVFSFLWMGVYFFAKYLSKSFIRPIDSMLSDPTNYNSFYDDFIPMIREYRKSQQDLLQNKMDIEAEHQKLIQLIENMSEGILLLDESKNVDLVNHAFLQLVGSSLENAPLQGKSYLYILRDTELIATIDGCGDGVTTFGFEIQDRHLHLHVSRIYIQEDKYYLCLLNDISYLYENEKQRNDFTANVSHELKTPLTSIIGYAQLINEGMVKEEDALNFTRKIEKSAKRMLNLINDIMELSFLAERSFTNKQMHSLTSLIQGVLDYLENSIAEKNISVCCDLIEDEIYGEEKLLEELFINVINNAIKYNKDNGSIEVLSKKENNRLVVSIKDSGIGVSKEDCEHLFERFYRVDKSRSKETGGTGLGLAIVKHIVLNHGGDIKFESELDVGSTLSIYLPFE